MNEQDFPTLPATFEFLAISLKTQAEIQLGLLHFGEDEKQEPDLKAAKHIIDMLSMLQDKTRGNLSLEEQRLTELRFRYVQAVEAAKPASETPPQASSAS
jgi:hypothetical protein